jgi:hypothetical protein
MFVLQVPFVMRLKHWFDDNAAKSGFVGVAFDFIHKTFVTVVWVACVGVLGGVSARHALVEKFQRTPVF